MNNRFFDHRNHAVSSARNLINTYKNFGGETDGILADELTDKIIVGIVRLALDRQETANKEEIFTYIMNAMSIKDGNVDKDSFDKCVNITAESFKTGKVRNDYQFFWNMLKEAMYCIETDVEEQFGVKLDASTIAYHISNAAKEAVGAVGLKFASDQLVF